MQPTQPGKSPCRELFPRFLKRVAADALSGWFVKSRRHPLLGFPAVVLVGKLFQIPSPFRNLAARRKDSNQAEWVDAGKR
jgi:hypothetical protein